MPPPSFQPPTASLRQRLARIFPGLEGVEFDVESTELNGNAWNTRSVQRLRIRPVDGGETLECVEKRLTKMAGVGPFEPVVQGWMAVRDAGRRLIHTPHLGVFETPLACYIYSPVVAGPHPNLGRIAAHAATGIAEMERVSARQLGGLLAGEAFTCWRMDFFRGWSLWRPRYNLALALGRPLVRRHPALQRVRTLATAMRPHLRVLARRAQASPRCFSHLDLISKNLIESEQGLHLIDWGEARVGRFGFDAGSYLHRLLRANEMPVFEEARAVFVDSYFDHLPPGVDAAQLRRNMVYFLALRTVCYFLRPEVLRSHLAAPEHIEQKLAWLLLELELAAA